MAQPYFLRTNRSIFTIKVCVTMYFFMMLLHIAFLSECQVASREDALEGLLVAVNPEMSKELADVAEYFTAGREAVGGEVGARDVVKGYVFDQARLYQVSDDLEFVLATTTGLALLQLERALVLAFDAHVVLLFEDVDQEFPATWHGLRNHVRVFHF